MNSDVFFTYTKKIFTYKQHEVTKVQSINQRGK